MLPQCMEYIEEAGMLSAVNAAGFQKKNGALFQRAGDYKEFDFREQFSIGPSETFEVQRATFDKLLADEAEKSGVEIRYQCEIVSVDIESEFPCITCKQLDGSMETFSGKFLLDASGFGRVLARLLNLEMPSNFPVRASVFTHIEDNITDASYDREKILITVHPEFRDVWYWLIPFSNGRCSIGVVAEPDFLADYEADGTYNLKAIVSQDSELGRLLAQAEWDTPPRQITGYSAKVSQLCSGKYALLGNAGEFLDPVFSSGVTIAMCSASIAARLLRRQLKGETIDWQEEYAKPLTKGVDTFRTFVSAWYDGRFQDIIFQDKQSLEIRKMICSILAGYAWDESNPYVKSPERRLNTLWQYCKTSR